MILLEMCKIKEWIDVKRKEQNKAEIQNLMRSNWREVNREKEPHGKD